MVDSQPKKCNNSSKQQPSWSPTSFKQPHSSRGSAAANEREVLAAAMCCRGWKDSRELERRSEVLRARQVSCNSGQDQAVVLQQLLRL
jgi:hypothetical protein